MPSFNGKTVWITGASSGIGQAVAIRIAREGARLALTARREDELIQLKNEIIANGGIAHVFPGDVTKVDEMKNIVGQIADNLGPVDLLITSAGTYEPANPLHFDALAYKKVMDVNYFGTLTAIEAVLPSMLARRKGYIAPIASLTAYRGMPKGWPYSATKAALNNFLEGFRFEVRPHNIRITVINPGFVKTRLTDKNEFEMPFLMEPKAAAEIILSGLKKGKMEIHFPWQLSWIFKFLRILPYPVYDFIIRKQAM